MLSPNKLKQSLDSCIANMSIDRSRFIKNPTKDFTRNSKCNLETTVRIILSFENQCLSSELKNYFSAFSLSKLPYKSTFVQQRKKFSDDAFKNLFNDFNVQHPFKKTKFGLHLLACDGTDVNIPTLFSDKVNFVEKNIKNGEGFYQIHCNALYDLCEQRFVDVVLQPRPKFNEGKALCDMVEHPHFAEQSALYICDRGYFSWNVAAHVIHAKQYFLIRAKGIHASNSTFKNLDLPFESDFDVWRTVKLVRGKRKKYKNDPQYRFLNKKSAFDFIDPNDRESEYELNFRIVSILLPNGNYEYLLTNLPDNKFNPQMLGELYKFRWGEETSFRSLKYNCALCWFHSIKRNYIIQEIYAKLLMFNYTSLLIRTVNMKKNPSFKHEHKISFSNAAKVARLQLRMKILNKIIKTLLLMDSPPIRDNRKAPRHVRCQRVVPLNNRA